MWLLNKSLTKLFHLLLLCSVTPLIYIIKAFCRFASGKLSTWNSNIKKALICISSNFTHLIQLKAISKEKTLSYTGNRRHEQRVGLKKKLKCHSVWFSAYSIVTKQCKDKMYHWSATKRNQQSVVFVFNGCDRAEWLINFKLKSQWNDTINKLQRLWLVLLQDVCI